MYTFIAIYTIEISKDRRENIRVRGIGREAPRYVKREDFDKFVGKILKIDKKSFKKIKKHLQKSWKKF